MSKKSVVILLLILCALSLSAQEPQASVHPRVSQDIADGSASVIVILKEDASPAKRGVSREVALEEKRESVEDAKEEFFENLPDEKGVSESSVEVTQEYYTIGAVVAEVDAAGLEALRDNPAVAMVIPNGERRIDQSRGTISGAEISLNESALVVNSDDVANLTVNGMNLTGHGEKICVIDTGIDTSHLFFGPIVEASNVVGGIFGGYDFVNNDANASDDNNHGTHVSGIAVGNFSPYFGTARNAQVVPVKVCNGAGSCPDAALLAGVDYCNNNVTNVTVISGSLGGGAPYTSTTCSTDSLYSALEPLLNTSLNLGIIPVFASGNNGCGAGCTTGVDYPACSPQVISVGSTTKLDVISTFTDRGGDRFDIYAPGQSITSSIPTFNVILPVSGTSQATPHVSGAIAVLQQNEALNGRSRMNLSTIRQLLQSTGLAIAPNNSRMDIYNMIVKRNLNYTVNLSNVSVKNDSSNSSIRFNNATDFASTIGCIELKNNFVGINSTNCPQYNKSAHVILGGVRNPAVVYVDGVVCPASKCANITLTTNGVEMDVQGFSNFTTIPGCPVNITTNTTLNQSISSDHTCITFGADNIELDCRGNTIFYANQSVGVGINATGRSNVTIRNCLLDQINASLASVAGVLFSGTTNSLISNVSSNVSGEGSHGFRLASMSTNNVLQYSTAVSNSTGGAFGVYMTSSSNNNTVSSNRASVNGTSASAIAADGLSGNNTYFNNSAYSLQNVGFLIDSSAGNTILNNTGLSHASIGFSVQNNDAANNVLTGNRGTTNLSQGMRIFQSHNNTLTNNIGQSAGNDAGLIVTVNANRNTLVNNTGSSNSASGILISSSADNTTLSNNTGYSNTGPGIRLSSVINVSMTNNSGTSGSNYGIELTSATNNTLINNTGRSNTSDGIAVNLIGGPNNTLTNNTGVSIDGGGITIGSSHNNTLTRNKAFSTTAIALVVVTAANNVLVENEGTSVSGDGIRVTSSTGTNMTKNNGTSTSLYGVRISGGSGTRFHNGRATSSSDGGLYLTGGAALNFFENNTFESNTDGAIEFGSASSQNNNFTNTTLHSNVTWIRIQELSTTGNNFTDTRFENSHGTVRVIGNFTLPTSTNITYTTLNVSFNRTFVNSTNLTFLNQSSEITLRNLPFGGANLLVDENDTNTFINCSSPRCTSVSFGSGVAIFNVTGFTAYAVSDSGGVALTKNDSADPVVKGALLTYGIRVSNNNNFSIFNVSVTDLFPTGVTVVSSQPTASVGNHTFNIGTMLTNTSTTVNITVRVGSNVANGTSLNNTANITSQVANGSSTSLNVSELTTVQGIPTMSTSKSDSPDPVPRGTTVTYSIIVANNGDEVAYNVTVTEGYPSAVAFNGSAPAASVGNATFSLGNLTPGQSTTLNITVNVSSALANGSIINNTYNVTFANLTGSNVTLANSTLTTVLGSPNVSVAKSDSVDPVFAGDQLVYTITLNNSGDDTAFNLTVSDGYPAGVSFVSSSPVPTSGNGTFVIASLAPSTATTVNITVLVNGVLTNGTILNNTVNVTSANRSGQNDTVNASQLTTVLASPILLINKTANMTNVTKGLTINYTITVNNTGESTAFNVTITEGYPAGAVFIGSTPAPTSGNGTFNVGNLSTNQSATITITLNTSTSLTNGSTLNNTLNVTANRTDGRNVSQSNSTGTTVIGYPQVSVTKTDSSDPVINGTAFTYTVAITNTGDEIAYNVTMSEAYPDNLTFLSGQPTPTPDNATFVVGNLLPGQTFVVNISVNLSGNMTSGTLQNNVSVTFANVSGVNSTVNDSETTTATIFVPFVPGGGGGGGGGGSSGVSNSQSMSGSSWSSNYLRAGDKVKFTITTDAAEHTMTVLNVYTDRAVVRIASVPQEFTIKKGAVQAVDVDLDGKPDLRVSVVDVAYSKALFMLEKAAFSPAVVREPPAPVVTPPKEEPPVQEQAPVPEVVPEPVVEEPVVQEQPSGSGAGKVAVMAGVLIIIVGALVAGLFLRKRSPPSDPLAEARKIDEAMRDLRSGVKEGNQLLNKAQKIDRK